MARFHQAVRLGPVRLGALGVVLLGAAELRLAFPPPTVGYPCGRAGFKPGGDSRGSYVSIVTV